MGDRPGTDRGVNRGLRILAVLAAAALASCNTATTGPGPELGRPEPAPRPDVGAPVPTGAHPGPGSTGAAAPASSPPDAGRGSGYLDVLAMLTVADPAPQTPYDRDSWSIWSDFDGDCMSTRHEILASASQVPVTVDGCRVTTGLWIDPYDLGTYAHADQIQVDHLVPVAEAHRAGGWAWDADTRARFANDEHTELVPAGAGTNQDKSDKRPEQWMPPADAAHCWYAASWVTVKVRYSLTVAPAELNTLERVLASCPDAPFGDLTRQPVGFAETGPAPTPPPVSGTPSGLTVVRCDRYAERVTIVNGGLASVSLTGWVLHDDGVRHSVELGALAGELAAGAQLVVLTGEPPMITGDADEVVWKDRNVWNNDGDVAHLVAPDETVAAFPCG